MNSHVNSFPGQGENNNQTWLMYTICSSGTGQWEIEKSNGLKGKRVKMNKITKSERAIKNRANG